MELDLLGRVGQVGLSQRVGQQTRQALQHEVKVLQTEMHNAEFWAYLQGELLGIGRRRERAHLFSVNPGQVIHKQVFRACGLHTHKERGIKHAEYSHRVLSGSGCLDSYFLFLYAGRGGGPMKSPSVVLQRHDEDLNRLLHQLLAVVGKEQVVVRDAVAHRVVGTHHVQQGGEQRQRVSVGRRRVSKTCAQNSAFESLVTSV